MYVRAISGREIPNVLHAVLFSGPLGKAGTVLHVGPDRAKAIDPGMGQTALLVLVARRAGDK